MGRKQSAAFCGHCPSRWGNRSGRAQGCDYGTRSMGVEFGQGAGLCIRGSEGSGSSCRKIRTHGRCDSQGRGKIAKIKVYEDQGHNARQVVYSSKEFYDWMFSQKRSENPLKSIKILVLSALKQSIHTRQRGFKSATQC